MYKILDFVQIKQQKNGKIKVSQSFENKENTFKLLKGFGYGWYKIDKKIELFKKTNNEIKSLSSERIEVVVGKFIKESIFIDMPTNVTNNDILDWFYRTEPLKGKKLINNYLLEELKEEEIHSIKLQTNSKYRKEFEIKHQLEKFKDWQLKKSIDKIATRQQDNDLFYKQIGEKEYLIFNYFNPTNNDISGFDCWIANYSNEKDIGAKQPIEIKTLQIDFNINRDYEKIRKYVKS